MIYEKTRYEADEAQCSDASTDCGENAFCCKRPPQTSALETNIEKDNKCPRLEQTFEMKISSSNLKF